MISISFILPYYNGADTIHTMLDSIWSVPLDAEEYEVIIVDDCSPVSAEKTLHDALVAHSNMRIIRHDINKRQGGAKNTGIRAASGEYIAFVDQDDVIHPENMYAALKFAMKHKIDMLACHYTMQTGNGLSQEHGLSMADGLIVSGIEFCEKYFRADCNLAPWAILYKREYLVRIARPFEENVLMEDSDWVAWHWIHAGKIGIFNHPIYTWIRHSSSITNTHRFTHRVDWIYMGYRKIRDAKQYRHISSLFANTMRKDGIHNIKGGIKKLLKMAILHDN